MNYPNLLRVIVEGFLFNRLPFSAPDVPVAGQGEVLAMHAANTAFFFLFCRTLILHWNSQPQELAD